MRDLEFHTTFPCATEAALAEFEQTLASPLPEDYRSFLLHVGGGWAPKYRYFRVNWPSEYTGSEQPEWSWLHDTYECHPQPEVATSMITMRDIMLHREPEDGGLFPEVTPIASADGGLFQVLLAVAGPRRGKVFLIETNERPADPSWDSMVQVADSFSDWLDSLEDATNVPAMYLAD